ncbi:Emc1 protein [Saccharomycopsis crataegensis]|uniref:ER membrane protein complex subunit 1 n=1 Tax=Saccharomycopsis crataegensis TaxID=43959 RepID=A0AAV5QUJ0_9ASCO|nr:Emc1 protein [Saccharomycopsis crataegensis]
MVPFCIFVLCFFLQAVSAVYSDEAFRTDWQIANLGDQVYSSVLTATNYITISNNGVLSVLNNTSKDGLVQWRHQLEQHTDGERFLGVLNNEVIVSGTDNLLQLWNTTSSFLISSVYLDAPMVGIQSLSNGELMVVDSSGVVSKVDSLFQVSSVAALETGIIKSIEISSLNNGNAVILINSDDLYLVDLRSSSLSKVSLKNDLNIEATRILTMHQNKVFFVTPNDLINVLVLSDHSKVSKSSFKEIKTDYQSELFKLLDLNSYILVNNFDYYASTTKDKSSIKYAYTYDENLVMSLSYNNIQLFDSELGIEIVKYNHNLDLDLDGAKNIKVAYTPSADGASHNIHVVIEYYNKEITSIYNDALLWNRDESLSEVDEYIVYDPSKNLQSQQQEVANFQHYLEEENNVDIFGAFMARWKDHWQQLKKLDQIITRGFGNIFSFGDGEIDAKQKIEFGLNKQLVVLTKNNKVFNLDMETGKINWKFSQLSKFMDTNNRSITGFLNDNNKNIKIWFDDGFVVTLDIANGMVKHTTVDGIPAHKKLIPVNLNEFIHEEPAGLLDDDLILRLDGDQFQYISNNDATPELSQDLFFSYINDDSTAIEVFMFNPSSKALVNAWKFQTDANEKIVATASSARNPNSMASIGLILGDKSTLYKYLYPNIISLAVFDDASQELSIKIFDSVSGKLIKSVFHPATDKIDDTSIQMIQGDNYLVYSFYSYHPTISSKIHVVEFYESQKSDQKSLSSITNQSVSILDYDAVQPFIRFKSYNFAHRIEKLALTSTKFDISTKNIIMKLSNGQIYLIPKFLISSRRIEGRELTNSEKMEYMNIPYDANLPINNNAIINHKRLIVGDNKAQMFSVATNLESTTIICYAGNDIFCTKAYPSSQFDVLSAGFNKGQLLLTIAALVLAGLVSWSMVERKKLNSFWIDNY